MLSSSYQQQPPDYSQAIKQQFAGRKSEDSIDSQLPTYTDVIGQRLFNQTDPLNVSEVNTIYRDMDTTGYVNVRFFLPAVMSGSGQRSALTRTEQEQERGNLLDQILNDNFPHGFLCWSSYSLYYIGLSAGAIQLFISLRIEERVTAYGFWTLFICTGLGLFYRYFNLNRTYRMLRMAIWLTNICILTMVVRFLSFNAHVLDTNLLDEMRNARIHLLTLTLLLLNMAALTIGCISIVYYSVFSRRIQSRVGPRQTQRNTS